MDTNELIKKVRKIEIRTRGLSKNIFSGEYHSAFKGKGMAFNEVREYQYGDDIRTIDWNVTSRFNHPYIKVFEEERELTVILLVDVSASELFGTRGQTKRDLITELSAVLAFSSLQNNDKIGLIFFSDKIEKFIPPKKGRSHVLRIIRELIDFKPDHRTGTDLKVALKYVLNVIKKRSIVFILSDFLDNEFDEPMKIISKKHDTIAVRIYDKSETEIPDIGLITALDAESGELLTFDSSVKHVRDNYKLWWKVKEERLNELMNKNKIDMINLATDESYIKPLINFFKKRGSRV
jgi:uncharacterized protein (DUF58 family)